MMTTPPSSLAASVSSPAPPRPTSTPLTCLVPKNVELQVPLAIGTLQWGTTWIDHKVINASGGTVQEETVRELFRILTEHRVTLYDTAEGYGGGTSEKRCGRLLRYHHLQDSPSEATTAVSDRPLIMTKFLPAPWRLFQSDLHRAVRGSCQRLGVDTIDVYLLHSPVHWCRPIEYWIEAGAECHRQGLLRAMGLSNCNADQVRRAVAAGRKFGVPVVCNQVHYSLLDYNSAALQEMQNVCQELDVKIVGFSPLGQGLLTDNLTADKFASNRPAKMLKLQPDDLTVLRSELNRLAHKYNKTMAQVSLNWCIQHNVVPLVGCRTPAQARDSVGCLGWNLSSEDVKVLDRVALNKSTLESPPWRRLLFVSLFATVMTVCRALDWLGYGNYGVPVCG